MLVENYRQSGVDGRPVVNTSAALSVTISFSLIQILYFDTAQQIITIVGWISLVCTCTVLPPPPSRRGYAITQVCLSASRDVSKNNGRISITFRGA